MTTQSQFTQAPLPQIPGFTLLELAGQGGMGAVYKADQQTPRRLVALKLLRRADSAEDLAAFRAEAQTIAALEHPHIVPLYTYGEHEGAPYLALRFLSGGTAAQRLSKGPIDLKLAARWIVAIADALDFAHQRGIIHRDLKPSNILLDESDNAYLSDFGIAGATTSATFGPATGSAAYMSPEQGRGEATDARSDLYSLAVTLFEMLAGQKPYTAETAFGVIVRHLNDPIPVARQLNPSISIAVDELIQWAMAKTPEDRPQSAKQFARLLQQAVANPTTSIRTAAPSSAATASIPTPTIVVGQTIVAAPPKKQSLPYLWIGLIALLLVICLGAVSVALGGSALVFFTQATQTPPPTATELPTREPTARPTLLPTATLEPDGGVIKEGDTITMIVRRANVEWYWPLKQPVSLDQQIEATITHVSGPDRSQAALLCRWQDQNNYTAFIITGTGRYGVAQKRDGQQIELVSPTESTTILTGDGSVNTVKVECQGSTLTLSVNGQQLAQVADPDPIAGDLALAAGLRTDGELVVTFENLK